MTSLGTYTRPFTVRNRKAVWRDIYSKVEEIKQISCSLPPHLLDELEALITEYNQTVGEDIDAKNNNN